MRDVKVQMYKYKKLLCFLLMCGIITVLVTRTKTNLIKGIGVSVQRKGKGNGKNLRSQT